MLKPTPITLLITLLQLLLTPRAHALSILLTSDRYWFDPQDRTPVQAWVDLAGLPLETVKQAIQEKSLHLGLTPTKLIATALPGGTDPTSQQVRISAEGMLHSDLMKLKSLIGILQNKGAVSARSELPLVPRILHMEDQLEFASKVSGVNVSALKKIVQREKENLPANKPTVFRYYLEKPQDISIAERAELRASHGDAIVSYLPAGKVGSMPVMIDGKSALFHTRDYHAGSIVGQYNPGLINRNIQFALTSNKFVESLFWKKYAPEAMPKTLLLEDFAEASGQVDPVVLTKKLQELFPNGWIIKGVLESNSNIKIVTDKVDVLKELETYRTSDFETFKADIFKRMAGSDEDTKYGFLQKHPGYFGFRINQYLSHPAQAIAQSKLDILHEYRMEVFMGKVIRDGVTSDRYIDLLRSLGKEVHESSADEFKAAEDWAQNLFRKLPPELQTLHAGMDAAKLKSGGYGMIEANLGVESSQFYDNAKVVALVNAALRRYQQDLQEKKINEGMTPAEQMKFLNQFFAENGIDREKHFPGYTFTAESLEPPLERFEVPSQYILKTAEAAGGCTSAFSRMGK